VFDEYAPILRRALRRSDQPEILVQSLRDLWNVLIDRMDAEGRMTAAPWSIGTPFGWSRSEVGSWFRTLMRHRLLVKIVRDRNKAAVYAVTEPIPAAERVEPGDTFALSSPGEAVVSARGVDAVRWARHGVGAADEPPMQRLARWVAEVEGTPAEVPWSAGDCVPLALGAFAAAHGRPANRPVDDGIVSGGLSWLVDALGVDWRGVGDVQQLLRAVAAAPAK
jgi:hypothetical protein